MKKTIIKLFFLSLLFIIMGCTNNQQPQVCYKNNCFNVELAQTDDQRATGLLYREQLGQDKGMLFVFEEEEIYPFWMKNTLIPLDMIWIDTEKKVVHIKENAQPCQTEVCPTIVPKEKAKYVLELNSGTVKEKGLQIDDSVYFLNIE